LETMIHRLFDLKFVKYYNHINFTRLGKMAEC